MMENSERMVSLVKALISLNTLCTLKFPYKEDLVMIPYKIQSTSKNF